MSNWKSELNRLSQRKDSTLPDVFFGEVPSNTFNWLNSTILKLREKKIDARPTLYGHINEEFSIYHHNIPNSVVQTDSDGYTMYEKFIQRTAFDKVFSNFWRRTSFLSRDCQLKIQTTWVNFQKKYEFNPPHAHTGILSWIIFMSIPYNLKEEDKVYPLLNDKEDTPSTSRLSFLRQNPTMLGGIDHIILNVDKSFEGKIIMFPSYLQHEVFPFYTSDDYRITVSGNAIFDIDRPTS